VQLRSDYLFLFFFGFVWSAYLVVAEFRADPSIVETLLDWRFISAGHVASTLLLSYVVIRFTSPMRIMRIALLSMLLLLSIGVWWTVLRPQERTFLIDVVLDEQLEIQHSELAHFFSDIQQPHIRFTLLSRPLLPGKPAEDFLQWEIVKAQVAPLLRGGESTTHTAFITSKRLAGFNWRNLFYAVSPRFSVISTYGVAENEAAETKVMMRKYLATMIPLAAMHGQAREDDLKLLRDRGPITEHGCLHDFSADKEIFLEKLRRGPKMCHEEAAQIESAFGKKVEGEYRDILARAAVEKLR
jgi:hypothetical protein